MRKRLKKRIHMAFSLHPYAYAYYFYCKGMVKEELTDFSKYNDDESLVTCKACRRDIKRQARLMQGVRE